MIPVCLRFHSLLIFTMMKIFYCLLSALSIVEMKPLNKKGCVGENVTITCSDWTSWTNVKHNDKYFCQSPCSKQQHIIVKAAFEKSNYNKRVQLTNSADGLFVTFTNLQKSDTNKYYCGVDKFGLDSMIEVNLEVTDAESFCPKTNPKTVIVGSTLTFAVTNSFTMSSNGSETATDTPTSFNIQFTTTTTSATEGAGRLLYLFIGLILILTILMVLLKHMRNMTRKQLKVFSSADAPQEDTQEDVEYDEIRPEAQPTGSHPARVSTVYFYAANTHLDPDSLYANYSYNQDTPSAVEGGNNYSKDASLNSASSSGVNSRGACAESRVTDLQCDMVYSVVQLPKEQIQSTRQSYPNQSEINENDYLYSLAELPQAT